MLIPLSQGQFATVDDVEFEWLSAWKWHAYWNPGTKSFYAVRKQDGTTIYMHREILGLKHGDERTGDHAETVETLDNRRSNLRIANHHQQQYNKRRYGNNRSGFKGVGRKRGKYRARISAGGVRMQIGTFDTPEEAHAAICSAAKDLHGEFARVA